MAKNFKLTAGGSGKSSDRVIKIDEREDWKRFYSKYGSDLIFYRLLNLFTAMVGQSAALNNWDWYENTINAFPNQEIHDFFDELKVIILKIRDEELSREI